MSNARLILAILLILTGVVWILQGVNILPGSFMTGDIRWAVIGAVCLFVGFGLLAWRRESAAESDEPASSDEN